MDLIECRGKKYRIGKNPPSVSKKLFRVTYNGTDFIEADDEVDARRIRTGDGDGPPPRDVIVEELIEVPEPKHADLPDATEQRTDGSECGDPERQNEPEAELLDQRPVDIVG